MPAIKLPNKFKLDVKNWMETRSVLRELEKREKELNANLKNAVRAALESAKVNDPSTPVFAGDVLLKLDQINPTYGAEITADMVGKKPLIRRGYETLKAIPNVSNSKAA